MNSNCANFPFVIHTDRPCGISAVVYYVLSFVRCMCSILLLQGQLHSFTTEPQTIFPVDNDWMFFIACTKFVLFFTQSFPRGLIHRGQTQSQCAKICVDRWTLIGVYRTLIVLDMCVKIIQCNYRFRVFTWFKDINVTLNILHKWQDS